MKPHPVFKTINKKFIQAVDVLKTAYREHPIQKNLSDGGIGKIISPSNPSVVGKVRKDETNLNHYQLLTFADHFKIPYEYFYYEDLTFTFSFDQNNPDNFFSKVDGGTPTDTADNIEKKVENTDDLKDLYNKEKVEVYKNLYKNTQEMNKSKDDLIAAKNKQIEMLTQYNDRLEEMLDQNEML